MQAFFQIRGTILSSRGLQFAALPRVVTGRADERGKARRGDATMERQPLQNVLIRIKRHLLIFPITEPFSGSQALEKSQNSKL